MKPQTCPFWLICEVRKEDKGRWFFYAREGYPKFGNCVDGEYVDCPHYAQYSMFKEQPMGCPVRWVCWPEAKSEDDMDCDWRDYEYLKCPVFGHYKLHGKVDPDFVLPKARGRGEGGNENPGGKEG